MNGLEAEFGEDVSFVRLNAAEAEVVQLQQTYGLRGHPSAAILDAGGKVAALYFGPETAETLGNKLNEIIE